MKLRRSFILLAAALLAAACATVPRDLPSETPSARNGTLVFSLGAAATVVASSHTLYLARRDGSAVYSVTYKQENPFGAQRDFDDAASNGVVVTANLPPGEYVVRNFGSYRGGYPMVYTFTAAKNANISFDIHAGETTYIGEYLAREVRGENLFGTNSNLLIYFVVSDQSARDIAIARRKNPGIEAREVVMDLMVEGHSGTPLFRRTALPPTIS